MPPRWASKPPSIGEPGARIPMATNPPAMTTSRMKLGECGKFISVGSHVVGDGVPPAGETDFDAPVVRARRFGRCRVEVTTAALGAHRDFGFDSPAEQPGPDVLGALPGEARPKADLTQDGLPTGGQG